MRGWAILVLVALCAPFAAADDVFRDDNCDFGRCVSPVVCVDGVHSGDVDVEGGYCQGSACEPALSCQGDLRRDSDCGVNATVEGQTCQADYGVGAGVDRPVRVTDVFAADLPVAALDAGVVLTDGNATLMDLPNTWTSDSAHAGVALAGFDLGSVEVAFYRSNIDTMNHTFSDVGASVSHSGPSGTTVAGANVFLLDLTPVGCRAGAASALGTQLDCPRFPALA